MLEQIKKYMEAKAISRYDLSKRLNLPSQNVYDVFSGKRPFTAKRAESFLNALNLEVIYTIKEKE